MRATKWIIVVSGLSNAILATLFILSQKDADERLFKMRESRDDWRDKAITAILAAKAWKQETAECYEIAKTAIRKAHEQIAEIERRLD